MELYDGELSMSMASEERRALVRIHTRETFRQRDGDDDVVIRREWEEAWGEKKFLKQIEVCRFTKRIRDVT